MARGAVLPWAPVSALQVGRTNISIRELLHLTAGSVIGLDRDTSVAFDVLVNATLAAHGEAVVVNEQCAIRFFGCDQSCRAQSLADIIALDCAIASLSA